MKDYLVYLESGYSLTVSAFKFEVEYLAGNKNKITFFKDETTPDENIIFKGVTLIIPHLSDETEKYFRVYFKENTFFDVYADHFKVWSEDMISFRDSEDRHLSDIFVDFPQVVAILPI